MFLPENIDLAYSEKYVLTLRLAADEFAYSIHCPTDASVFHYQKTSFGNALSYAENVQKLIFDFNIFTQFFRATHVVTASPAFTLVPDAFFEKNRAAELFDFNFQEPSETVLSDAVCGGSVHVVYGVDEKVHSFLSRNLSYPQFRHYTSPLIDAWASYRADEDVKRCFVDFNDTYVTVVCFAGDRLLSVNSFPDKKRYDALYFIASVWEKLSMNQDTDILFLSGDFAAHPEAADTLRKLIRHVEPVVLTPSVSLTKQQVASIPTDIIVRLCE
jgi:hypothetical protein